MGDLPQHLDGGWPNLRKRGRPELTENLSMSSDPAIFSSDDDPSVDNYVGGRRRKKQYVGSWFHSHELPAAEVTPARPPVKRTLTRQMDSGVWMGSDISDDLDALEKEHAEVTEASVAPEPADDLLWGAMDPAHQEAQRRVAEHVEFGNEIVDLQYVSGSASINLATRAVPITDGPLPRG